MLPQLVGSDIVNILFKYRVNLTHLTFMIETFELLMKRYATFDSLFVNNQCATAFSLEKVNLKFKLVYLLNHLIYFNKICKICCVNTHTQSESLAQICTAMAELQHFFLGDCFYWYTLYMYVSFFGTFQDHIMQFPGLRTHFR